MSTDRSTNKITVTGTADPWEIRERLEAKIKKKVDLLSPAGPKKEKEKEKEKGKDKDKEKAKENKESNKKEKEEKKDGGKEAKSKDAEKGKDKGEKGKDKGEKEKPKEVKTFSCNFTRVLVVARVHQSTSFRVKKFSKTSVAIELL